MFVPSDIFKFTADEFLDHLQPQYSSSQALKMKEVDTFKFFNDVIQKFEDGKDTNISTLILYNKAYINSAGTQYV